MKHKHLLLLCAVIAPASAHAGLSFLSGASIANGAEILSFDASSGSLLSTYSGGAGHGVQLYDLGSDGSLGAGLNVDLSSTFGSIYSLSSVVADSQGRGFGVATLIPGIAGINEDGDAGTISDSNVSSKAVFFSLSTGSILNSFDVGYHADSVTITPDGRRVVVANEAEYALTAANPGLGLAQRPGSLSVIDLDGVVDAAGISGLTSGAVVTKDFSAGNLGSGVNLAGLRNNDLSLDIELQIEPEYVTADNGKAYVTLQENNAVAVYDFDAGQFTAIHSLGTINQTIDASDRDPQGGGVAAINVNDTVAGMPMPDTVAKFTRDGKTYLVTANEGDARIDGGDEARAGSGAANVDIIDDGGGDQVFSGSLSNSNGIGRLNISTVDGNTDGDAGIEVPTMFGTRSFSIWDSETGELVLDSASMIENYVALNDPTTFNIDKGADIDTRSDNKGPEPEAVAFGRIDGRDYVFVAAERQNGIFQFDVTDFENAEIVAYYNAVTGTTDGGSYLAPESLLFLAADAAGNTTGKDLLIAGYEVSGSIMVLEVTSAIPEPASGAALFGLGALGFALVRRRAVRR